ncbi:hypothetical protein ACOMHN_033128 [Nucella lapillus]
MRFHKRQQQAWADAASPCQRQALAARLFRRSSSPSSCVRVSGFVSGFVSGCVSVVSGFVSGCVSVVSACCLSFFFFSVPEQDWWASTWLRGVHRPHMEMANCTSPHTHPSQDTTCPPSSQHLRRPTTVVSLKNVSKFLKQTLENVSKVLKQTLKNVSKVLKQTLKNVSKVLKQACGQHPAQRRGPPLREAAVERKGIRVCFYDCPKRFFGIAVSCLCPLRRWPLSERAAASPVLWPGHRSGKWKWRMQDDQTNFRAKKNDIKPTICSMKRNAPENSVPLVCPSIQCAPPVCPSIQCAPPVCPSIQCAPPVCPPQCAPPVCPPSVPLQCAPPVPTTHIPGQGERVPPHHP